MERNEKVNFVANAIRLMFLYDFCIKTMFCSSLPPVVCIWAGSCLILRYLCLFAHCGVHHIFCICCVFLRLVYSILPVALGCPFLIAPSVFANVYFEI